MIITTHKQFPNYKRYEIEYEGRPLVMETGKLAELCNSAVLVSYGETTVLVTCTASARPKDGVDYFPLSVDFNEKLYAVGRIPGSFMRREGKPSLPAVLASRLWEIEVKGGMPKLLYTLQERRSLFAGKAAFGLLEILLVTLLETGAAVLLGIVHGYTEVFPTGQLVYLFICTLAVDAMLFFGEFLLMLWVGNPLPALCVGIVGALVGLFSAFMPPLASYFVPFGYYIPLSAYEVANWDKATHTVTYGTRPFNWVLLAFTLALGAVLFALAWRKVQDEEV